MGDSSPLLDWLPTSSNGVSLGQINYQNQTETFIPNVMVTFSSLRRLLTAIKWMTKSISLWLSGQSGLKHADAKCWRDVREVQAEEFWKGTYTSYARGVPTRPNGERSRAP